ncbi:MAG: hypothetical protein IKO16_04725 [Lachnospiraceae bacterium]|nr:hypothetical protein [Lachnospiraceae bacterium]
MLEKNKWMSGLVITLMMVVFFALPVMAKEYTVDLDDHPESAVPVVLKAGDVVKLSSDKHDGHKAVLTIRYFKDATSESDHLIDPADALEYTIEEYNGITEWYVFSRQAYRKSEEYGGEDGIWFYLTPNDFDIKWKNECKKGTVGNDYDTAYWVFYDLDKLKGYKSTACTIESSRHLPEGISVSYGADPRNDNRMGLRFKGTPKKAGTFNPVVNGKVTYSDGSNEEVLDFEWRFTIEIEEDKKDDDDDDDEDTSDEPSSSSSSSSQSTWTPPAQTETPQQQAATQAAQAQASIASFASLPAANKATFAATGMPLDMTKVSTLDAATSTLLVANNSIPYNVTIMFNGQPFAVKIPAGFNYSRYVKTDGSINIHEVLWAVLSGARR